MKDTTTILIVDEHTEGGGPLARALSTLPGLKVVAQTGNPILAAELAHQWSPDVILADFKRGPRPRAEMAGWILASSPGSRLVIHTTYYVANEREEFRRAGASLCLLKGLSSRELGQELRHVTHVNGKNGTGV
jgi:DNA-binding NarL/FixJ family response regulator